MNELAPAINGKSITAEESTSSWIPELIFDAPQWLWLLIVPAVLLVWVWKRRGRRLAMPFDYGSRQSRRYLATMISFTESLLPVVLILVVLILCLPLKTGNPIRQRRLTNIEFCVDCSGSMTAQFGDGNRYDASMAAINEFLSLRKGDAFGLTFFATDVIRWCPLTRDASAFECALPFMKPDSQRAIGGGTMIARAVQSCRKTLQQEDTGDRMIVLVSDGMSADLMNGASETLAADLKAANVVLFAIHIGGGEIPPDVETLAQITGGSAFASGDVAGLEKVFARIDAMKPVQLETVGIEYTENLKPFCLLASCLLLVWGLGSFQLRYSPW